MADKSELSREDLLLLLAAGADGPYPVDPVRLMKGAFLATRRGRPEWGHLFQFEAYDYGPFDRRVYDTRDTLIRRGLLDVSHGRYERYEVTPLGRQRVSSLRKRLGDEAVWLGRIGRYVSTRSFSQLLDEVYAAYPQYRARSRYRS